VVTYVAHVGSTKYGVADSMDEYVGIAMSQQTMRVGNFDASKKEWTSCDELVYVVAKSDAHN
jgi:hypothetical protein